MGHHCSDSACQSGWRVYENLLCWKAEKHQKAKNCITIIQLSNNTFPCFVLLKTLKKKKKSLPVNTHLFELTF